MRLLLIPGFWFAGDLWGEVPERLAGEYELDVDVATLAGQGDGDAEATLDDQLDGLLEIVDDAPGPVIAVGHSAAATLAWLLADRRPDRIAGVVIIGGMPASAGTPYASFAQVVDGVAAFPGWESFESDDVADLDMATRERLAATAVAVPAAVAEALVEYRDERRFDVPMLLVCPEFSPEQAREWIDAGAVPEYSAARRLELVDIDSGHWPMATVPAELARILADYAHRLERGDAPGALGRRMTPDPALLVRPLTADDEAQWRPLFRGYREFYRLEADEAVVDRVWGWLLDPEHEVRGIGVERDGELLAIGHYRRFARPSTGTVGIWLDDLFTTPDARGGGAARAVLEAVRTLAAEEGCSIVRGITASDNHRAQALYDQLGTRTDWVVYDGAPRAE